MHLCVCLFVLLQMSYVFVPQPNRTKARSCSDIQKTCKAVVLDGCSSSSTAELGALGTWGKWSNNVERDLHRHCNKNNLTGSLKPYYCSTTIKDSNGQHQPAEIPILLPHEMVDAVYNASKLDFETRLFGEGGRDACADFWERSREQTWFHRHSARRHILREPSNAVPVRLHGDDAPTFKSTGIFVLQWCSVLCRLASWLSRFLIMCVPTSNMIEHVTLEPVFEAVVWSFQILATGGAFPRRDHLGREFAAGSHRKEKSDGIIAGGLLFITCQVIGDWKWLKEEFRLRYHYGTNECCWKCRAKKRQGGRVTAWNFGLDAPWASMVRTHEEFMTHLRSVLCKLPGFHVDCLLCDIMHLMMLGCLQWANGGVLWELATTYCLWPGAASAWKPRMKIRLEAAYEDFKHWLKAEHMESSQGIFTIGRLSMSALHSTPMLKAKAGNGMKISYWLCNKVTRLADQKPGDHYLQVMALMMWGYCEMISLLHRSPLWLDDDTANKLMITREAALFANAELSGLAIAASRNIFPLKPKLHMVDHLCREAASNRLNPAFYWTFADEDFIGRMKSLAKSCHRSTVAKRVSERYVIRLFALIRARDARWRNSVA